MSEIIDVHCHFGPTAAAPHWNAAESVATALKARGVTMALLASTLARRYDPVAGNDVVADAVKEGNPDCEFRGWIVAVPDQLEDVSAQLRRYLYDDRFVGAALYPDISTGDPVTLDSCREFLGVFRRFSKPLLIGTPDAESMRHAAEIAQFMGTGKIIAVGMGGDDWRTAVDIAVKPANLFLEISGALDAEKIAYAAKEMTGYRKLLFGSGAPFTDPTAIVGLLDDLALPGDDRAKICAGNARRVFGWVDETLTFALPAGDA